MKQLKGWWELTMEDYWVPPSKMHYEVHSIYQVCLRGKKKKADPESNEFSRDHFHLQEFQGIKDQVK
jgi:hypothetical protein